MSPASRLPPAEVLALAEAPHAVLEAGGLELIKDDRFIVLIGSGSDPRLRSVERPALGNIDEDVAGVRAEFRNRGFHDSTWWVGPSATPLELAEELRELGMTDHDDSPLTLLALQGNPRNVPIDVDAGPAATRGDEYAAFEIQNQSFDVAYTPDAVSRALKTPVSPGSNEIVVLARDSGGAPFSMGILALTDHAALLQTAATLPSCRGRGGYRAVVGARCEIALARGAEWIVTQAGRSSRPILVGMGFEPIGIINVLVDRF